MIRLNMKFFAIVLGVALSVGTAFALDIGDEMPAIKTKLKNIDGEMLSIGELKGEQGTLIVFTCVHCPAVKATQSRMVALGNKYSQKDIGVVFINSNDPKRYPVDGLEGMRQQAKENGYKFPYLVDDTSSFARKFGAERTPEMFLFDASGKLVYHGTIDDSPMNSERVSKNYLKDALKAVLAGEDVPTQKTRSVGCGIKFSK